MNKNDLALPEFDVKKASAVGTPNSILIFGPAKRGKSVCAASIVKVPGFDRVLFIDVEGGASAIAGWYPEVDVIKTPTAAEFIRVGEALLNGKLLHASGLPYQAVIIDTFDKAQERQLEVFANDPKRFNRQGVEDHYYKWGLLKTWTSKIADLFHMAPFLTIFVAHEDDHKEEGGPVLTTVYLQGKSRLTFPSTPDIIGRFYVTKIDEGGKKENHRVLDFTVSDKTITGQRYADKLNGKIIDPTLEKVFRAIEPERFGK